MALNFLTSTGNASCVKLFEVRYEHFPTTSVVALSRRAATSTQTYTDIGMHRLENSNLILRGNRNEAPSVLIKGSVVLCLSQPFRISDIHLRLTGESQIG